MFQHARVLPHLLILIDRKATSGGNAGSAYDVFNSNLKIGRFAKVMKQPAVALIPLFDNVFTSVLSVLRSLPHWDEHKMLFQWLPSDAERMIRIEDLKSDAFADTVVLAAAPGIQVRSCNV
jgi:hypothetical protein